MKTKKRYKRFIGILLILFSLVLSACIQRSEVSDFVKTKDLDFNASKAAELNSCNVFKCKNKQPALFFVNLGLLGLLDDIVDPPSLDKSICEFDRFNLRDPREKERWDELLKPKFQEVDKNLTSEYVRLFMLGVGSSIAAADEGQRFCRGSMGFAIHKLDGSNTEEIQFINGGPLACSLKSDVIPLFIYEQESGSEFTRLLAENLKGKGPVIVAPNPGINVEENPNKVVSLIGLLQTIKRTCGSNCLTEAIVNFEDTKTVSKYRETDVSIIGYIIDNKKIEECSVIKIIQSAQSFSQFILTETKKPSMIILNITEGPNNNGNCDWTSEDVAKFHEQIIISSWNLAPTGVIGVGIYDSASLGSEEAFNSWFLNCRAYYTIEDSEIKYATPIIFADKGDIDSRSCEISNRKTVNMGFLFYSPPDDYSDEKAIPVTKSQVCGDVCYEYEGRLDTAGGSFRPSTCNEPSRFYSRQFAFDNRVDPTIIMALTDQLTVNGEINMRKLAGSSCGCTGYTGQAKDICCVAETFANYHNQAAEEIKDKTRFVGRRVETTTHEKEKTYLAIVGSLFGQDEFNIKLSSYKSGQSISTVDEASRVMSKAGQIRTICGLCKE